MDPIACINQVIAAAKAGEWDTYAETLKDYNDWVDSGGFRAPMELVAEALNLAFDQLL